MPKIHEMLSGKFLKKEDVGRGALLTVAAIQQENVALPDEAPEQKWTMHFHETDKLLVLNSTNIQLCAQIFASDDTDQWINRRIVLYTDPNVAFKGKVIGGIRVRAPKTGTAAMPPSAPMPSEAPPQPQPNPAPTVGGSAAKFEDMADDIPF